MNTTDTTTLISLFHSDAKAQDAITELRNAGIPANQIHQASGPEGTSLASLRQFELSPADLKMLDEGLRSGGAVIVLSALDKTSAEKAESIFRKHHAGEVDEHVLLDGQRATGRTADEASIPVIEEELLVGKRAFQSGGVRVVSRVIETPVTENITLREEHATITRRPVDRAATEADIAFGDQSIEVIESEEEAVLSKTARVVEEVVVGKDSSQHTERVSDTVRKTEIEVEQLSGDDLRKATVKKST